MSTATELHTPTERPVPQPTAWNSSVLAPVAAGAATLCASTSLTGVITGWAWLGYIFVAIVLVACTGLALRSLRAPTVVVGLAQMVVLAFLVTGSFTTTGILKIIPGPAAFAELGDVITAAAEQIRTTLPPADASPPLLALITMSIGLVAVLIDTLAVAAAAPAATGLVLLCVYAVPASLSDEMLPWWTFLLGAGAFAGLLAIDGNHRHRRWRNRDAPGLGNSPGTIATPVAVVSLALVLGLIVGTAVTGVGTVGALPGGTGNGKGGNRTGGYGVNPFTQMRGLLDQGTNAELFKVRGLGGEKRFLRAFTLDTYKPDGDDAGWRLGSKLDGKLRADMPSLPPAIGDDGSGSPAAIEIQPTNWVDYWLPMVGQPRAIQGITGKDVFYDPKIGAVFALTQSSSGPYTEIASLKEPTKEDLRDADSTSTPVDDTYTSISGVNPEVGKLARQVTENATNNFDKATALWRFFTPSNGFVYDTKTAPKSSPDGLADFVLRGKRGFCEQFASAMAVMLRSLGIPSRVAIGFTPGEEVADYRAITTKDAHAWVEVYFGDKGWVSFDPTPLSDNRGFIPSYLQTNPKGTATATEDPEEKPSKASSSAPATGVPTTTSGTAAKPTDEEPTWPIVVAGILGLLALLLTGLVIFFAVRHLRSLEKAPSGPKPPDDAPDDPGAKPTLGPQLTTWLPLAAAGLWVAALAFLAAWLSVWFAVVLVLTVVLVGAPALIRDFARRRRLQAIAGHSPAAADAAWQELMAECADRGLPIPESDTVRVAGQKLAQKHHLDDEGREGLRTVIGVVERSWYSEGSPMDPRLDPAFDGLRRSLRRNAPMSWRGRLFPKSIFRRKKP
ncbi:Transglutaminase-like superfamily protein [Amycolatopsis xylanica]|uniref:Transglutaminase-like superfamily protein n=1 Tax=Amycolatopsis xylanica TaxID=589385 RepID=A0A1H3GD41_9PSEU|nr:DUF3488 and transglutaminase-like domain-containing protein [Amycolatopsis xylanica]SDY00970.1 Transglutaminase-like superfamily protein [Amycolatopsis xylanica]